MDIVDSIRETNKKATNLGEKYLKTSYEYYKLKIFQQLSISVGMFFKVILIGTLLVIGLVFIALGLALSIGESLGSYPIGFISMGLIFFLFSSIALLFKKRITDFVVTLLSKTFFS